MSHKSEAETPVQSPCILVCTMDIASGLCLGCARKLNEIARWSTLSNEQRQAIIDVLPERHRQLEMPPLLKED